MVLASSTGIDGRAHHMPSYLRCLWPSNAAAPAAELNSGKRRQPNGQLYSYLFWGDTFPSGVGICFQQGGIWCAEQLADILTRNDSFVKVDLIRG